MSSSCDQGAMPSMTKSSGTPTHHRHKPSGTPTHYMPMVLNAPLGFSDIPPTNITWAGGAAPYSLTLSFTLQNTEYPPVTFEGINTTHFVWVPTVRAGTSVFLHLVDERGFIDFNEDPIFVISARSDIIEPSLSQSNSLPQSTLTSIPSATPNSSASLSSPATHTNASTIAPIVVGAVIFLLLATLPLWRSRIRNRRRRNRKKGRLTSLKSPKYFGGDESAPVETSKEQSVSGGSARGPGYIQRRATVPTQARPDITGTHWVLPEMNPFEDQENVLHTEETVTASPVSDAFDEIPARHSATSSLPPADTALLVRPSRLKVVPTLRTPSKPMPHVPVQSNSSDTRTPSETPATHLSTSTSSTIPPSYHTRPPSGAIQVDIIETLDYPPFPPPVYTPQLTERPIPASGLFSHSE